MFCGGSGIFTFVFLFVTLVIGSLSYLLFCITVSDSHRFAHGDAPYKTEILQYGVGTLNQLVVVLEICEDNHSILEL